MSKGKRLLFILHHSKPLWAVFSLLFSLCLVIGSTYSWLTASDQKINKTATVSEKLSIQIDEKYQMNLAFLPGSKTVKEVRVKNNWQIPAAVKVSLYELFAGFEVDLIDQSGNGNLKNFPKTSGTNLDQTKIATWTVGNTYPVKNGFWKVNEVVVNNPANKNEATKYKGPRTGPLSYLTIDFNTSKIFTSPPPAGTKDYWLYENGFFYYSEILKQGERTTPLVQSVSLSGSLPNRYKGALYQLIPVADGHDLTEGLLPDWSLTSGPVYDLYQPLLVK